MTQKTTVTTGLLRNRTNENPDEVLAALRSAARDGDSPAKAALAERLLTCPPYSLEEGTSWAVSGAQDIWMRATRLMAASLVLFVVITVIPVYRVRWGSELHGGKHR